MKNIDELRNDIFSNEDLGVLIEYTKGFLIAQRYIPVIGELDEKIVTQIASLLIKMECEEISPITLLIHTSGGSEGFLLENIINSLRSPVDALILGKACLMGGILFQMCRKRKMLAQSLLYCHYPTFTYKISGYFGSLTDTDIRTLQQDFIEGHQNQLALFSRRTGKNPEELEQFFRMGQLHNFYIPAKKAVEFGLADEVVTDFKFFPENFKGKKIYDKEREEKEKKN